MRRIRNISDRISYIMVLLAMVLYVGLRIVPHHHCLCNDVQETHVGFGECGDCHHSHHDEGDASEHPHSTLQCCNGLQFCRCSEDEILVEKKSLDYEHTLYTYVGSDIMYYPTVLTVKKQEPPSFASEAHKHSSPLRAPPVV